jgi:hypothetical protein
VKVESVVWSKSVVLMGRWSSGYDDSSNYMGGGTRGMDDSRRAV